MEDNYTPTTNNTRGSFLYCAPTPNVAPPNSTSSSSSLYGRNNNNNLEMNSFHIQSSNQQSSFVKTEATQAAAGAASSSQHAGHQDFPYSLLSSADHHHQQQQQQQQQHQQQTINHFPLPHQEQQDQGGERIGSRSFLFDNLDVIKAKIITHPQYSNLLEAYMDCQKVGAPAEVVNRLTAVRSEFETNQKANLKMNYTSAHGDPELDQFMEAYCDMLAKYREELTRPLHEAMEFMRRIEEQLKSISNEPLHIFTDEKCDGLGSSEDDQDDSRGETEVPEIDPRAEDRELKNHLLKKYSGYLSSLKQELSKKKKKGKLPKEARQKLLNWWELHYKWPYPSETEKVALAESTGLDQKQINNWFINQRKRHWKPSEDMQFVMMEGLHPQNAGLYMDGHFMADGNYRLGP
ncbi:hypothetical protein AQUCO_13300021v1 [Aquilegia coerulea]|uniref:Uncharacterized protein n=1 Tax=Aquilegia coerulea TaxID=218851 RepID=A0A2G5C162_AQUCA|nr:hypothetical protein AQUCO_13300021v1 [Aquilegia coerulea]